MLRDLSKRSYQPELMDSFDEPIASLKAVFQDINRVNHLLNQDILKIDNHTFHCDILINTLTMHHFTDEQVLVFLKKFTQLARYAVVINDLQRSRLAYYLFYLFSSIFIKTKIAKIDGLISIRRAFIKKELQGYSEEIRGTTHSIDWKWAFRYVWILKPNHIKENA